jgi:hypothetical protein
MTQMFFTTTLLHVRFDILLICGKDIIDCMITPREEVKTYKTSFIEVPELSQSSERLCM